MRLSEYIEKLQRLLDEHGDHEVVDTHNDPVGEPEFIDDDGDPAVVICDMA